MKEFIVNTNIGYYLWAEFLSVGSVVPDAGTLICAEFRTATIVKQPEGHALSFHSNLLMQILFWWDWSTAVVNFFSSHSSTVYLFFFFGGNDTFEFTVSSVNTEYARFCLEGSRNVLNIYWFRHCAIAQRCFSSSKLLLLVQEPPQALRKYNVNNSILYSPKSFIFVTLC